MPDGMRWRLGLVAVDDDGVAGVVAALIADDHVGAARRGRSMILPLPSSPHWAPITIVAGT